MSAVPEPLEDLRLVGTTPLHETHGTRVALSSGEAFWVQADLEDVAKRMFHNTPGFVWVGRRLVNRAQVAQLTHGPIPSTEPFERLEEPSFESLED